MEKLNQNERDVIRLLREHPTCSIAELEGHLRVTATAVRQRLNRLMAAGLVDRCSESDGRGRPSHRYRLTKAGQEANGNNLEDFAGALWQEIRRIPDDRIRQQIIAGVADRLASSYEKRIEGHTLQERLESVARLFDERDVPAVVEQQNGLPVLKILACPYPELVDENREVCDMEKQLFSRVTGGSFDLCQCRQDGDRCCSFQAQTE